MTTKTYTGDLRKMASEAGKPVQYQLRLNDDSIPLNPALGKKIRLHHTGNIHCMNCGTKTKKSYSQGFCFNCMRKLAQCDMCILKPETCHYEEGTCREPEWGEENCMQPHFVYLANSSGVKVGITRHTQVPTRWIDQGAVYALPIFRVASRLQSGLVEHALKQHIADKTNWRKMLTNDVPEADLRAVRDELFETCKDELEEIRKQVGSDNIVALQDEDIVELEFPVTEYPEKVRSLNMDKTPEITGTLMGIKGQYFILDTGVLNIRKYGGYEVEFSVED